jgi:hypothetical protein
VSLGRRASPGGRDIRCPTCTRESNPAWHFFETQTPGEVGYVSGLPRGTKAAQQVALDWMHCANEQCRQLIVRVHDARPIGWTDEAASTPIMESETWIAFPRFGEVTRPIDPLVRDPFRTDYLEAAAILDTSHRMSAVLARRILGDLLRKYGGHEQRSLTAQIDAFTKVGHHPSALTDNLHHFREVGDFAAHTQEDQEQAVVIDVDREEAEWTLDLVDRLFEYFIVQPAKDEQIKTRMDAKIERAGRKPLRGEES